MALFAMAYHGMCLLSSMSAAESFHVTDCAAPCVTACMAAGRPELPLLYMLSATCVTEPAAACFTDVLHGPVVLTLHLVLLVCCNLVY